MKMKFLVICRVGLIAIGFLHTGFIFAATEHVNDHSPGWQSRAFHYGSSIGCKLNPPPERGSKEELADFKILLEWQNNRSPKECERAKSEAGVSVTSFFGGSYGPLTARETEIVRSFYEKVRSTADLASDQQKKQWQRLRPFVTNSDIRPLLNVNRTSLSYPSGHATIAATTARALSKLMPYRTREFLARADQIALDRVIAGVHHPSDVESGKNCGAQVFESLMKEPEFLQDLEKTKKELNPH